MSESFHVPRSRSHDRATSKEPSAHRITRVDDLNEKVVKGRGQQAGEMLPPPPPTHTSRQNTHQAISQSISSQNPPSPARASRSFDQVSQTSQRVPHRVQGVRYPPSPSITKPKFTFLMEPNLGHDPMDSVRATSDQVPIMRSRESNGLESRKHIIGRECRSKRYKYDCLPT